MGCIEGTIRRIDRVRLGVSRLEAWQASLVRRDWVRACLGRIESVAAAATRIEQPDGTVRRVCHIGTLLYIRVTPAEPQWLMPDVPLSYQVQSNTAWEVV